MSEADLPMIPANLDAGGAVLWAQTALMHAAIARGWNRAEVRGMLIGLTVNFALHDAAPGKIKREFDAALASALARRARQKN